jgi:uncharacterized membrane protein YsdA (DUF1294 family)
MPDPLVLVLGWLAIMAVVTVIAFGRDKVAARRDARRTRERTLWTLVLAGGVVGGWVGMLQFRHKTLHRSFWAVQWLASALWGSLVVWLLLGGS